MANPIRKLAKVEQVPEAKFFSIEFPGHIENINKAKEALGGEHAITNANLRYRIRDPFSIPIHGQTVSTGNFLLKATRRYKVKRQSGSERSLPPYRAPTENDVPYDIEEAPEYKFEMVGMIPKTARFSGLADYQHIVDPRDEIVRVKQDLQNMEYENLISIKIDNTDPVEDISTMQVLPPVAISKTTVPHPYRYKARDREDAVKGKPGKKKATFGLKRKADNPTGTTNVDSNDSGDDI
ncbi:tau 95 subunit of transcription factor TFIIIC [Mortierella sp. AM989]|nr:tau 95 subunit of transcription factor TFIIIC [Mortierella sp. AM989]